jgi:RNA polymerase sigma-70 factor (ECF subfamily)
VFQALDALSDRDRELIGLRYGAGLKARQIAELLDSTPNAIDVSLHRAVARMRAFIDRMPRHPSGARTPRSSHVEKTRL